MPCRPAWSVRTCWTGDDILSLLYDSHGQLIVVSDSHPRRNRADWGNLPVPPAAWTPDPAPVTTKPVGPPQAMR